MLARFGHGSNSKLEHLFSQFDCDKDHSCETCISAKHQKIPFQRSSSIANALLDLVHADLWGPYHTPTLTGARYFLTVLDDYSKVTWIYLLQNKKQVFQNLVNFIALCNNHFEKTIKCFRIDNGAEIVQQQCRDLFC